MPMPMKMLLAVLIASSTVRLSTASVYAKAQSLQHVALEEPDPVSDVAGAVNSVPGVKWPKESAIPKPVQYMLASTWVLMLAMIPIIIPLVERKPPTKTQLVVGTCMMAVLFGGVYLFTNVLLFQSSHFKEVRSLTIVECIYFMAQVITTVGYGDITPAAPRGQVFVGLYVLGALFIIAMLISELTEHMVQVAQEYKEKHAGENRDEEEDPLFVVFHPQKPSAKSLLQAFAIFTALDICWIIFFSSYPGEEKTLFQATYMSVITLSTVGFGWFTPLTEAGMIFGAFWMLFGSAALVNVITEFTSLTVEWHEYERVMAAEVDLDFRKCGAKRESQLVRQLKEVSGYSDEVTETQFLRFALQRMGLASTEELASISDAFEELKPKKGQNGCKPSVNLSTVEECLHREESHY